MTIFDKLSINQREAKRGFTLAEMLLSILVIGIISTIILPSVYKKIQEIKTVNQVKRNIETFTQAAKLVIDEYGSLANLQNSNKTSFQNSEIFFDEMAKHLKVSKKCKLGERTCFPTQIETLDGRKLYNWYSNHTNICSGILVSGESFWVLNNEGSTQILFDINGGKNKPNKLGVDQFHFSISSNTGNIDLTFGDKNYNEMCNKNNKTSTHNGYYCTQWIWQKSNMDYYYKK